MFSRDVTAAILVSQTMKWRPCWCPKPILWKLNSFLMQTLSFVPINLHRRWPHEWKHSILKYLSYTYSLSMFVANLRLGCYSLFSNPQNQPCLTPPFPTPPDPTQKLLKVKNDHQRSLKNIRASTGFEPVTSALPVRCSSEVNLLGSYLPWGVKWSELYEIIHFWSPDFFQASSFQLLKLEKNLLQWSFFTFIYNRSSKMNYFIQFTSQKLLFSNALKVYSPLKNSPRGRR